LDLLFGGVGETADVEAAGRNGIIPRGLDALRRSPAFGFGGDGESSMMRTHPAESRFLLLSDSLSLLRFGLSTFRRVDVKLSQLARTEGLLEVDPVDPLVMVDAASAFAFGRPVMLPIRSRGTRVWIFCSRFRTRARISETICTPLFFEVDAVLEVEFVLIADGLRAVGGR
jgi:hypothetical protein